MNFEEKKTLATPNAIWRERKCFKKLINRKTSISRVSFAVALAVISVWYFAAQIYICGEVCIWLQMSSYLAALEHQGKSIRGDSVSAFVMIAWTKETKDLTTKINSNCFGNLTCHLHVVALNRRIYQAEKLDMSQFKVLCRLYHKTNIANVKMIGCLEWKSMGGDSISDCMIYCSERFNKTV